MFTEVSFPKVFDNNAWRSTINTQSFSVQHETKPGPVPKSQVNKWRLDSLPPGFKVVNKGFTSGGKENPQHWEHRMSVSDGLATVSVFLSPVDDEPLQGASKMMGSTHAYGRVLNNVQVMVVGEAPSMTLQSIAEAVKIQF